MTLPRRQPRASQSPSGVTGIHRYFAAGEGRQVVKVLPGGVYVSSSDEDLVTVVGSCVAVCIHDATAGVGGMNHFMLPEDYAPADATRDPKDAWRGEAQRFGCFAMEQLINEILKGGGHKDRFAVKAFGGANSLGSHCHVGAMNEHFIRHYLRSEGLTLAASDFGGASGRKIKFCPGTGQAFLWRPAAAQLPALFESERRYRESLRAAPAGGEVELF